MTPLAMRIVKEMTLPVKKRVGVDPCGIKQKMADVHCFDISSVKKIARELGVQTFQGGNLSEAQMFLPAPKTWIEWDAFEGARCGFLLEQIKNGEVHVWQAYTHNERSYLTHPDPFLLDLRWYRNNPRDVGWYGYIRTDRGELFDSLSNIPGEDLVASVSITLIGALALINSPKVIGRNSHTPHRGLQKDLLRQQKLIGNYPLHAWTEIILDVTPPKEAEGQHDYEAYLTGRRALHFVRAHLRIRDGKLCFVKAHWRGDAALGIKQSRYVVKGKAA